MLSHLYPLIGAANVVAHKIVLYIFPQSFFWGTIFIDIRKSKSLDSVKRLSHQTAAIKEHNAKLLTFPEGARNNGKRLLPFKVGPFLIAIQSQSMILPVVVQRYTFMDFMRLDNGMIT